MPASLKIGEIEITPISDGPFPAPLDSFVEFERAEVERLTGRRIDETVILPVNSYLLKLGPKWALVDTGCGPSYGPTLGQLPENLRTLGVRPEAIEHVLLTHIHPDHALGLIDAAGEAVFPNAELIVHEQEANFWLDHDPSESADERVQRNRSKGQGATRPYRERMRIVNAGEVLPGVTAILLAGHTPGHTGWHIHSGSDGVLIWGDIVHFPAVQVPRPDAALVFDSDRQAARETRQRTFDRVAADRLRVAGAHLDFPGFGYIVRHGAGYQFEPDA
jgi:glyoxylase-like metal-dependent hydrolase (beta-lactamase superfamily II)